MKRKLVIAALVAFGCSSERDQQPASIEGPSYQQAQALTDPEINPNDTYTVFDATISNATTVELAAPIVDPATGQQSTTLTTESGPDSEFHVQAGYTSGGTVRTVMAGSWAAGDTQTTGVTMPYRMVLNNGQLQEFNISGVALPLPTTGDGVPGVQSVLASFGSDILYGDIVGGVSPEDPGGNASVQLGNGVAMLISPPDNQRNRQEKRKFKRSGSRWVLEELEVTDSVQVDGRKETRTMRLRLRNVAFNRNAGKDSARAEQRRQSGLQTGGFRTAGYQPVPSRMPEVFNAQCVPNCDDPEDPPPPPPPPPAPPAGNIAFMHGYTAGPGSVAWMSNEMNARFFFGTQLLPSTSRRGRAPFQTNQMLDQLSATGASQFVVVGHSLGGLLGRRAAQLDPNRVRGVVSIGSPHLGAMLALQGASALTTALQGLISQINYGCANPNADIGCFLAASLYHYFLTEVVLFAASQEFEGLQDLRPVGLGLGNPWLSDVNSTPESFPRFGIQSFPAKRWVLARQAGDVNPLCGWGTWCAGNGFQNAVDIFYKAARFCSVFGIIIGRYQEAITCNTIANGMHDVDTFWNRITAPGSEKTDAIVQGTSQLFPNTVKNLASARGESHAGEMRSPFLANTLAGILETEFLFRRR